MNTGFKQLLLEAPAFSGFDLYENNNDPVVIGYHGNKVYTFNLALDFSAEQTLHPPRCIYQEFSVQAEILLIYKLAEKFFVLDCAGGLYSICLGPTDDDTGDIFDDSPSIEPTAGDVKSVVQVDVDGAEIVSACFISSNYLALLSYNSTECRLVLTVHPLDTFEALHTLTVKKHVMKLPKNVFMIFANNTNVEEQFVKNWFPHFQYEQLNIGYVFIFNCNDAMCAVQLAETSPSLGFFFSWPFPCVFASFEAKNKDRTVGWSCLLLAFEDGAVVKLSAAGGQTLHFASRPMSCAVYCDEVLFTSDNSDCQVVPLEIGESYVHPIKGIIGFCHVKASSSHILALTNFGGLYLLNQNHQPAEGKHLLPDLSSFQETLNNIAYLEELNAQIVTQDRAINCLAVAQNSKNFQFLLDVQVVQIVAHDQVFKVGCRHVLGERNPSALIVSAQDWHLALEFALGDRRLVHVQRLKSDFTSNNPLELMVRLSLDDSFVVRDFVVDVKLISFTGDGKYRPILPLGKVSLDVLSFIEPDTSLLLHSAPSVHCKLRHLNDVLLNQKFDTSFKPVLKNDLADWKFSIKLPTSDDQTQCDAELFSKLLSRSQALWRSTSWNEMCSKSSWSLGVGGCKLFLEVKSDRNLEISSNSIGLAILVKHAILRLFKRPPALLQGLDERELIEAEDMLKNLEIMAFSEDGPSLSELGEVYKRKVKVLNDRLYETVSFIK